MTKSRWDWLTNLADDIQQNSTAPPLALPGWSVDGLGESWRTCFDLLNEKDVKNPKLLDDILLVFAAASLVPAGGTWNTYTKTHPAATPFLEATGRAALCELRKRVRDWAAKPVDAASNSSQRQQELEEFQARCRVLSQLVETCGASQWTPPGTPPGTNPLPMTDLTDATLPNMAPLQLIKALDRLPLQSSRVWFPVTLKYNSQVVGYVISATIHLLSVQGIERLKQEDSELGEWAESLPDVTELPWSALKLDSQVATKLVPWDIQHQQEKTSLCELLKVDPKTCPRILYELHPAEGQTLLAPGSQARLPSTAVTGESLRVAISLAIWAANNTRELKPLVVTGNVNTHGVIDGVDGVPEKAAAVDTWANATQRQSIPFLYRDKSNTFATQSPLQPKSFGKTVLQVGSFPGLRVIQLPYEIKTLLSDDLRLELLTDGFDGLRTGLDQIVSPPPDQLIAPHEDETVYLQEDFKELDDLSQLVKPRATRDLQSYGWPPEEFPRMALPFNNETLVAARYMLANMRDSQRASSLAATELPSVVPVFLSGRFVSLLAAPESPGLMHTIDSLLARIQQGLGLLGISLQGDLAEDWQRALRNRLVAGEFSKPLLVGFSSRSLDVDYPGEEQFLKSLAVKCGPTTNNPQRLVPVLLASDIHHLLFLEQALGLPSTLTGLLADQRVAS